MTPLLEVAGLMKAFAGTRVLYGVGFEVRAGLALGLLGENGSGQSTTLNILGGVLQPDEGTMRLDGQPYAPQSPRDATAAGVAFVHQELNLFANLTIADNIHLDAFPRGRLPLIDRRRTRAATERLLRDVDLDMPADTKVARLSQGERQRGRHGVARRGRGRRRRQRDDAGHPHHFADGGPHDRHRVPGAPNRPRPGRAAGRRPVAAGRGTRRQFRRLRGRGGWHRRPDGFRTVGAGAHGAVGPKYGDQIEFAAVAAAVLGGVSLFGGRGGVAGTVFGAILIKTTQNGLNVVNADPYSHPLVTAVIIFVAVAVDGLRTRILTRLQRRTVRPTELAGTLA